MNRDNPTVPSLSSLRSVKPKAVRLSPEELIKSSFLEGQAGYPLVLEPAVKGLDLVAWAATHGEYLERQLMQYGAILFRHFELQTVDHFEQFTRAISPDLMPYGERSSPRSKVSGGVYTSTDHPPDQFIILHNEQSYTLNWPMKIWFFCVQPAQQRGRTPIADSRKIFNRLDQRIKDKFAEKQILYVRNYGEGLGLPWQEVFQTTDKSVVEAHCRNVDIECEWKDQDRLRTRQVRPAIRVHPRTGEKVWFNHALFFNLSGLEVSAREAMLAVINEEDVPFNTFYGDGTAIENSVLDEIRGLYSEAAVSFEWEQGDILMLDNMLSSHGREPFTGPRRIVVAMAQPFLSFAAAASFSPTSSTSTTSTSTSASSTSSAPSLLSTRGSN